MKAGPKTDAPVAMDRAGWIEDAFDALDLAAILFDADGRCVASNRRYDRTFLPDDAPPLIGETVHDLARRIGETGRVALFPGMSAAEAAAASETAVRAFTRAMETPMADGRLLIGASNPIRRGGYLVTFRDATPERLGEHRALELLDGAFESAEMSMMLWDATLRVQRVNAAWRRMIGEVTPGDLVREHVVAFLSGEIGAGDAEGAKRQLDVLIAQAYRKPSQTEYSMRDGRLLQIATFPTESQGVLATAIDVTATRTAEVKARQMLEGLVEALGEGVALYDKDLRMLMNNGAFRRLVFDDQPLSAPGTHLTEEVRRVIDAGLILAPEDGGEEAALAWILECVRTGATDVELPMSQDRTLEVSNFRTRQGDVLIAMRDVTERKRAERATREADELVRTIVEANPTAFLMSRVKDGRIIYISPLTQARFGAAETTRDFFYDPADRGPFVEALSMTGGLDDYPVRLRAADGALVEGLMSARVVDYKGERAIVSGMRDVTDYLEMQRELEHQREIAHQNEKLSALGELLAGVAHELNNPLSVVIGYAMMLQEKITDPVLARQIDEISTASERCARIVRTFLAMARQRPAEIAPVCVNETVELALEVAGYGLRAAGGEIVVSLAPTAPPVAADADQIVQVFSNLIVNAEHALTQRGKLGRLTITSRFDAARQKVVIEFADNGIGIDPSIRQRIFEPFFTTKAVGAGTGVGLAFCHRIVTAHGGQITVESEPSSGARFVVMLPVLAADSREAGQ